MLIKYVPACSSLPSLVDDLTLSPPSEHRALLSERLEQAKYIHTPPVYTVTGSHYDTWKRIMRLSLSSDLSLQITHPAQKRLATPTGGGGGGGGGYTFRTGFRPYPRRLESLIVCRCMARTDHGKSGKSWNLRISFSRPGKSWNFIVGPWKSLKIKVLFCSLGTTDDRVVFVWVS